MAETSAKSGNHKGFGFWWAMFVGVVLTLMGVLNFFVTMPGSPMWAIVLCLITYIPFAALGDKMVGGTSPNLAPA